MESENVLMWYVCKQHETKYTYFWYSADMIWNVCSDFKAQSCFPLVFHCFRTSSSLAALEAPPWPSRDKTLPSMVAVLQVDMALKADSCRNQMGKSKPWYKNTNRAGEWMLKASQGPTAFHRGTHIEFFLLTQKHRIDMCRHIHHDHSNKGMHGLYAEE